MPRAAIAILGWTLIAAGCSGGGVQSGSGATSSEARPAASDRPAAGPAASAPASAAAPSGAPRLAPSDASEAQRKAAALRALHGDVDPKLVAVEATDNGLPMDPTLRDKVAPPSRPPQVRMGATTVSGKLPPEVIQRIVRQSFGRFRLCYENGLKADPTLAGKVEVKFTIAADGAVPVVADGASTLPDATVRSCVVKAFKGLSFPSPESGIVTVTYPINFSPGQ